ncbi:MAG: RusA family crossover junction endodeoxyribonuclease [Thermoanaerobaculia bacterium]|nr:RusA family crossover junction endodeoxyribonuclease [Thermoanaerobaculia bacterium]
MIPKRPLSHQARRRERLREWKDYVRSEAARAWGGRRPCEEGDLSLTLICLCGDPPLDVDNIIKPIQDALVGPVIGDDVLVTDVRSHRLMLSGIFDIARLPVQLVEAIRSGRECVYVRLGIAPALEDIL